MRRKTSELCRKTSLHNCQILKNLSGNIKIFPYQNPIFLNGFPTFFNGFLLSSTAFSFLQQLSTFLNGSLLSSMAFRFPQWLSAFLNGFLLSSTAFRFPQQLSAQRGLLVSLGVSITNASRTRECGWLGLTKPFEVSESNHDARRPPLDTRQRSHC